MSDQVPSKPASGVVAWLAGLNLPEALSRSALGAVNRLVAGAVDYPAAWLERLSQEVRDGTAARSAVSRAISEGAVERAADPELAARALAAWMPEVLRKQQNREAVASASVEHLSLSVSNEAEKPAGQSEQEVDPDWMNIFVRHAEDASSDRMRDLWGRVLAGEIRSPGSVSLSTLRFLSEVDSEVALKFAELAEGVVQGVFLAKPRPLRGQQLADLKLLEEYGLLFGLEGSFSQNITFRDDGTYTVFGKKYLLILKSDPGFVHSIPAILLTRVGREVFNLVDIRDEIQGMTKFFELLPRDKIKAANIYEREKRDGLHHRAVALRNEGDTNA